jgi:hypothetical protein
MKVWVDLRSPAEVRTFTFVRTFAQAISSLFIACIRMSVISVKVHLN